MVECYYSLVIAHLTLLLIYYLTCKYTCITVLLDTLSTLNICNALDLLHKSSRAIVTPSVKANELVLLQEVYYKEIKVNHGIN